MSAPRLPNPSEGIAAGSVEIPRDSPRLFVRIVATTLPMLAALILVVWFVAAARSSVPLWTLPALLGVVGALSAVHALTTTSGYARTVRVGPDGVRLQYRRFGIEGRWSDWSPLGSNWVTSGVSFRLNGDAHRYYVVTADQARAILRHPNRPEWELDETMRRLTSDPRMPL